MNGDPLARAISLVASLRPDWRGDPEGFYARRSEALACLRRAAAAAPCAGCEADGLRERLRRAHALLRHAGAETGRLRRLLTSARPKPRRAGPATSRAAVALTRRA